MKTPFLIFSILLTSVSCSQRFENAVIATGSNSHPTSAKANSDKELSIEDVKFNYDKKVFSDVKSSIIPAFPLERKDYKPDNVRSRSVRFEISYLKPEKVTAEISVYKLEEYKNAFSLVPRYVTAMVKNIADLQSLLKSNDKINPAGSKELPFIPYIDAHQEFYAKAKVIKFQNGKGLLFLTQIAQESTIINNEDLVYIFEGLTNDNRHFIYARFPVSAEGLPAEYTDSFEGYKMPYTFFDENGEENSKAHKKYLNKIALRLDKLEDEKFMPNLSKIEMLFSSMKIK